MNPNLIPVAFLDCGCCGDEGAVSYRRDGLFTEGQKLICRCKGAVSVEDDYDDNGGFAYVSTDPDCDCWKREHHNTRSRRSPKRETPR